MLFALCGTDLLANVAGGIVPGFNVPVTSGDDGQGNAWIDNGIIRVKIQIYGATVLSMKYLKPGLPGTPLANGVEMIGQSGSRHTSAYGGHTTIYYSSPDPITFYPCTKSFATPPTDDLVDMALTKIYNGEKSPWDTVIHYVLRKGSPGLYTYLEEKHPASYGAAANGFTTLLWPSAHDATNFLLENVYIDNAGAGALDNRGLPESRRHGLNPSFADADAAPEGSGGTTKETLLINNPGSVFDGFVDCKYSYAADYWKLGCWGRASDINKLGGWFVIGSPEAFTNGVNIADYLQGWGLVYLPIASGHGGLPITYVPAGTDYKKILGPYFLYMNSKDSGSLCWADAQAQAAAEKAAWPYSWLTYNPLYQTAAQRATVTGKIVITDAASPGVSAGGAWVGLADPDDGFRGVERGAAYQQSHNWQYQNAKYQYWVKAAADGSFTIPDVATTDTYGHPASYSLYAFTGENSAGSGAMGEYQTAAFSVAPGQTVNLGTLTWRVPHKGGSIVFQIGKPDRQSHEFRFGDQSFQPAVWKDYATGQQKWYPDAYNSALQTIFSNPIEYDVATNDLSKLPFAHTRFSNTEWKWNLNFNLPNVASSGNYWLNIAYAGHGVIIREGNWNENHGEQRVYVNGTAFTFNTFGHVTPAFYPDNQGGDILIRYDAHNKYAVAHVPIPASMLHPGANTITLSTEVFSQGTYYDCITLETPPPVDDGVYTLDNQSPANGLYTMGLNAAADPSIKVYNYAPNSASAGLNEWQLVNLGTSNRTYVMFKNRATGKYLTGAIGGAITQAAYDGSWNQVWQMQANGSAYLIRCSGQGYLSADAHTIAQPYTSGANTVALLGANGSAPGQKWRLRLATPVFTTAANITTTTGDRYYYTLTANNAPASFTVTGLPPGFTFNPDTGLISGTSTAPGTYALTVTASNSGGTATTTITMTIAPAPAPATPTDLNALSWDGQVDLDWSSSPNATGYTVKRAPSVNGTYTAVASNINTRYFSDRGVTNGTTYFYKVSAQRYGSPSADSAAVSASPVIGLGDRAWAAGDIGSVSQPGSSSYANGTYTLTASGADIWNSSDAFQYMSQPLVGDGAIVARVASVSNPNAIVKAGVMIRASRAPNAANMSAFVSPSTTQGVTAQWRLATDASTSQTLFTGVTAPYWVKLVRAGSTFTAYRSVDGVTWTLQSTQTINMTGPVYAGLALTAHNNSSVCTATFDSVSILPGAVWSASDIGSPAVAGFTAYSGGTLRVDAAGVDIWGTSDQFRYVYQPASGDCDITVRMTGIEKLNGWAKTGIMIRETLAANSAHTFLMSTAVNGIGFESRLTTAAGTAQTQNGNLSPRQWLRLTRVGNTFTGSTSPDGVTWTAFATATIPMAANVSIGVASVSHDAAKLGAATMDNLLVHP